MYLLIGDIGGTRTRLRLLEKAGEEWLVRHQGRYPSGKFPSLAEVVDHYLNCQLHGKHRKKVHAAWFAVAGPVQRDSVIFTNLPWVESAHDLAEKLDLPAVHLVNDLEAQAQAIPFLPENQLIPIQGGAPGNNRFLIIAAGTGLGMATLQISGESVKAFSSEGGHCDLAPVTDVHSDLLRHLQERFAHVSYERVLSGPGLLTLHDFVQRRVKVTSPPGEERRPISSAGIAELANLGDPVAVESIELFIQLLGAFAGNAALQWLALGGVYLAGGVTVGLQSFFASHTFTDAFQHKGRMRPLMEQIPVAIVADDDAGLEGITRLAIRHNG